MSPLHEKLLIHMIFSAGGSAIAVE